MKFQSSSQGSYNLQKNLKYLQKHPWNLRYFSKHRYNIWKTSGIFQNIHDSYDELESPAAILISGKLGGLALAHLSQLEVGHI
jgi:hypothetical protein